MKTLKRLKEILTGEKETEKEEETAKSETSKVKEEKKEEKLDSETETVFEADKAKKTAQSEETKNSEKEISESDAEKVSEKKEPKTKRSGSMSLLERGGDVYRPEDIDPEFKQQVMDAGAESLALCFQCGTCTGACPSGRRTPYRVRQIVRKSLLGLKKEVIEDDTLWMCSTCYECQERCPREIKIVDVIKIARNYAAQAGFMGPAHKAVGSFVIKTGHGVPINDATMELRKRVGLGELPPTTHSFPGALEEVDKIMKATQFDKLIGYNWEKGELE
jgi:heterodisulfide reductase subunit C2